MAYKNPRKQHAHVCELHKNPKQPDMQVVKSPKDVESKVPFFAKVRTWFKILTL